MSVEFVWSYLKLNFFFREESNEFLNNILRVKIDLYIRPRSAFCYGQLMECGS